MSLTPIESNENLDLDEYQVNSVAYDKESFYDDFQVVYIDDDKYLRMGWELSARENNIRLLSLSTPKFLEEIRDRINPEVTIYIDRDLGPNELKGELWAYILQRDIVQKSSAQFLG